MHKLIHSLHSGLVGLAMLVFVTLSVPELCHAQTTASGVPVAASTAPAEPAVVSPPTSQAQASPASPCMKCPPQLTATEVQAVVNAASAVQLAAAELKKDDSFWASVGVNVFSNRLDAFLFGQGAENRGLAALLAAWFTLVAATIKLFLAWRPEQGLGRRSGARRFVEISLSVILCISGALAVLAVHTARESVIEATEPNSTLVAELSACQQNLKSALALRSGPPGQTPPTEILTRIEAACASNQTETVKRLGELEQRVDDVRTTQIGWFLKLLIFLGFVGIAFLTWRARR